jgi:predicted  nucleic acid-binding Zn-ribbon protein
MQTSDFDRLAEKVDKLVDDLKRAKAESHGLAADKKKLEEKVASLEKQIRQSQKEGNHLAELLVQNKAHKKKNALLKSRVVSMLAKIESLQ